MSRETKATRRLAVSAVLAALGVVLLLLGSLVQVLDLSMAAIASLLVVFAVIEIGGKYPILIYLVTSVLSLLLLPVKTAALIYFVFAGYYPILKAVLEGRLAKPLAWCLKIAICCAAVAAGLFAAGKLFFMDLRELVVLALPFTDLRALRCRLDALDLGLSLQVARTLAPTRSALKDYFCLQASSIFGSPPLEKRADCFFERACCCIMHKIYIISL